MAKLTDLHIRVHKVIKQQHLIPRESRILLGVSGGQDSLCMMHLLNDLTVLWDWKLHVLHCNHRWIASEEACAEFVCGRAKLLHLPHDIATAPRIHLDENRARQWRYRMFSDWALRWNCQFVITAHTGSDRAETFLFNLVRGSGAEGLTSLKWSRPLASADIGTSSHSSKLSDKPTNSQAISEKLDRATNQRSPIQLVRPLLEVWRKETQDYCQTHNIPIWDDPFNDDLSHPRNRIRNQLIPLLQEHFNPQVERALNRTADILADQAEDLDRQAETLMLHAYHENPPRLDRLYLGKASVALQRQAIRRFLRLHALSPQFEQVETIRLLLHAPHRSKSPTLKGGLWAEVDRGYLVLHSNTDTVPS